MMSTVKLFASILALALLLPAGAAAQKQVDWSQFRFDAGKTGCNKFEKVINKDNVGDLVEAWDYNDVLGSTIGFFFSSPVVDGKIYVDSEDTYGGFLAALDAVTGDRLWNFPQGYIGHVESASAVAKGVVYAVSQYGYLVALDAATGDQLWTKQISSGPFFYGELISSPALVQGVVYVGSSNGNLYAFDAKSGDPLWVCDTGALSYVSSPAVAKKVVYVVSDSGLHAVSARTGAIIWTNENYGPLSFPVVAEGRVFVGGDALNPATGAVLWSYSNGGTMSSPAVVKGVAYIASSSGEVYALEVATGQVLWSTNTGQSSAIFAAPTVANGVVYVGSHVLDTSTTDYALDAATGELLWENTVTGGYFYNYYSPVAVNGMVYTPRGAYTLGN